MKRILWLYNEDHHKHPFIVIAARSLAEAGFDVTIANASACDAPDAPYRVLSVFPQRVKRKIKPKSPKPVKPVVPPPTKKPSAPANGRRPSLLKRIVRFLRVKKKRKALRQYIDMKKNRLKTLRHLFVEIWWRPFCALSSVKADVIVATRPEAGLLALVMAKLRRKRLVYYPFEVQNEQGPKSVSLHHSIIDGCEALLMKHADALITQNACRAAIYHEERHCTAKPTIVHNYKPRHAMTENGALRAALGELAQGKRIVLYEGYLTERRWLEQLACTAALLDDDTLLVMMGDDRMGWALKNEEILRPSLDAGRLAILPSVPHHALLPYVADADVGVIIYDDRTRNNYFCEPGKLSDYIAVGVPVIAPAFPTIKPVLEEYRIGVCFDAGTPESIARAIRAVLAPGRAHWQPALARAAAELTWESQFPALLSALTGEAR
jgi:glycosyltransferase involved in cell wall biosynthesis